jgi:DNA mismatch repair ATPase MutS
MNINILENLGFREEVVEPSINEKGDHELNTQERMYLMNKHLDEQILYESLSSLMDLHQHSFIHHMKEGEQVHLNDYVFQDIEMLSDHYGNVDKSIFSTLNYCETQSGKVLFKELILHPIYDIAKLEKRQKLIQSVQKHSGEIHSILREMKSMEK